MARGGFRWDDESLFRRAPQVAGRIDAMVGTTIEYWASRAEGHMRANAPWQDQTGNARAGLNARTEHLPLLRHSIILSHTMPYGIWLEVRWSGRYAIIDPTMQFIGPKVMVMIAQGWGPAVSGGLR